MNYHQEDIASLKSGIARAEATCERLLATYGHGVRPSFVSEDLAYHGERAERYKAEIAALEEAANA